MIFWLVCYFNGKLKLELGVIELFFRLVIVSFLVCLVLLM